MIFSAGHSSVYKHPSKATAERYLAAGVSKNHIFRTDLGMTKDRKNGTRGVSQIIMIKVVMMMSKFALLQQENFLFVIGSEKVWHPYVFTHSIRFR